MPMASKLVALVRTMGLSEHTGKAGKAKGSKTKLLHSPVNFLTYSHVHSEACPHYTWVDGSSACACIHEYTYTQMHPTFSLSLTHKHNFSLTCSHKYVPFIGVYYAQLTDKNKQPLHTTLLTLSMAIALHSLFHANSVLAFLRLMPSTPHSACTAVPVSVRRALRT